MWRVALVENPARLSCRDNQLRVEQDDSECTVPLEDVATIIIENAQVVLTAPLLQQCSKRDVAVVICDEKHLPTGIFLPLAQHSRGSEVVALQMKASRPFCKRIWQQIVGRKIENQAHVLSALKPETQHSLLTLKSKVKSGDPENVEAQAARVYWNALFSPPFRRWQDSVTSHALNFGYSIARSVIARAVVARGLLPLLGIHHQNKLNQFNLVDDLLEPFRPVVDAAVYLLLRDDTAEHLNRGHRRALALLARAEMELKSESLPLVRAAEGVCSSFVSALRSASGGAEIDLPSFSAGTVESLQEILSSVPPVESSA